MFVYYDFDFLVFMRGHILEVFWGGLAIISEPWDVRRSSWCRNYVNCLLITD